MYQPQHVTITLLSAQGIIHLVVVIIEETIITQEQLDLVQVRITAQLVQQIRVQTQTQQEQELGK